MSIRSVMSARTGVYHAARRVESVRSIYLHKGPRVAGLKRDPEQVFVTQQGHKYGTDAENIKSIKLFLSDKYAVSDELALQCLTHKSFGNGIKPHNEKLSALGSKLAQLYLAKYVIETPNTSNESAINGKNFDVIGTPVAKELGSRMALGVFAKQHGLNAVMFWQSYNNKVSFGSSGEMKVSAQMLLALVGAVNLVHGKQTAEEFIRDKLLGSGELENITVKIVQEAH